LIQDSEVFSTMAASPRYSCRFLSLIIHYALFIISLP